MKYTLALTERAIAHIANAMKWYESDRLGRADRFSTSLNAALERVLAMPHIGAPARFGLRRVTLVRFPYTIYYRVLAGTIEIRAVIHDRRKPHARWRRRIRETPSLMGLYAESLRRFTWSLR